MPIVSEAQLRANRANAKKSTGPRTEEGKTRASLNALKHGGTAQTIILPGEDASHFLKFHSSLKKSLVPANALEESLVATLAQTQWAMDRMRAHETSLFALGHEKHASAIQTGGDEVIQSAFAGALTMKIEMESFKTASLYLQRNTRMYDTTLRQLLSLQATRKAEEKETVTEALRVAEIHRKRKIPFSSNDYGLVCSPHQIEFLRRRKNADTHPYIPPAPLANASNAA